MKPAILILVIVATALISSLGTCVVMLMVLERPNVVIVHAQNPAPQQVQTFTPPPQSADDDDTVSPTAPLPTVGSTVSATTAIPPAVQPPAAVIVPGVPDQSAPVPAPDVPVVAQIPAAVTDQPPAPPVEANPPMVVVPAEQTVVVQPMLVAPPPVIINNPVIIVADPGRPPGHHPDQPPVSFPATVAQPAMAPMGNPRPNGIFSQPSPHPTVVPNHPPVGPMR